MKKLYSLDIAKKNEAMERLSQTPLSYRFIDNGTKTLILVYDSFRSDAFCRRYLGPLGADEIDMKTLPTKTEQKRYVVTKESDGVLTDQLRPKFEYGVNIFVERDGGAPVLTVIGDEKDIEFFLKDHGDYLEASEIEVTE